MKARLYTVILAVFVLTACFVAPLTIQTASASNVSPLVSCSQTDWWTDASTSVQGPYEYEVSFQATLEALHDSFSGAYCGYVRAKNTVSRGANDCNSYTIAVFLQDGNFNIINDKIVTYSGGCGGYYALFGVSTLSRNYSCPFRSKGQVTDLTGSIDFATTSGVCSL